MISKKNFSNLLTLLAIGFGLICGYSDIAFVNSMAKVTSDLFLRLLQLISLPLIFLAIAATISGMRDFQEMKKMGRKVVLYTFGTTIVAATIALILYVSIDPAKNVTSTLEAAPPAAQEGSYLSFLLNIIPSNLFQVFLESNVMGIAFVAGLFSFATLCLPAEQKSVLHGFFSSSLAMMLKVTSFILTLMPLAVFAFAVLLVKDLRHNFAHMTTLFYYLLCVVSANLIQGIIALPLLLIWKKVGVRKSLKGVLPALTLAFFSKSSNATLPVTMSSLENNLKVSKKVTSFSLPLCSVINMNGCAAFILITTLFVSSLNGMVFSNFDLIGWIFLATLAAVGNAGVPMGCFFLTSAFLIGMDIPLYMMGIILPFYTILDMIETTLNVWSDACIALVVDKELSEVPETVLATNS